MKKIIKKMIADFKPEKYADERRKKVLDLLERKAKEKAPVEAPEIEEEGEGPADLVAALEESMRKVKKNR
jgi:DNA end-binding protein Ku